MNLYEKITSLYNTLTIEEFHKYVYLRNDMKTPPPGRVKVGNDYIHTWTHPTLAQPTQEQLDTITE